MRSEWAISIRRACAAILLDPKTYRYKSHRPGQAALEQRIREICQTRVRFGYRRVHVLLRREGWQLNLKKTYRIYKEMGMQLMDQALMAALQRKEIDPDDAYLNATDKQQFQRFVTNPDLLPQVNLAVS